MSDAGVAATVTVDKLKRRIAILGSTGSIGKQALEVVAASPNKFSIELLTAQDNTDLLIAQARQFSPRRVVIGNTEKYGIVKEALAKQPIEVMAGAEALAEAATAPEIELVLTALVGFAGLMPTARAIAAGKDIALANKETLVVAGEMIMAAAKAKGVHVLPVDSEHSAIYQCLAGEAANPIEKLILTASGGPFRGFTLEALQTVTLAAALKHPKWQMGAKITIDSATMMNKGLEVIEACHLFNVKPEQIEIVVHPQSIVHSLVQFADGSLKAQLGLPDMRLPIQYALYYPERGSNSFPRFSFADHATLSFEQLDRSVFRTADFAYHSLEKGGNMPCILNAANEIAVAAFLSEKIRLTDIFDVIERALCYELFIANPTIEELITTDAAVRSMASTNL